MIKNFYQRFAKHITRKRIKISLIPTLLLIIGLLAFFKLPLLNKNNKQLQYQLQDEGSLKLVNVDVETEAAEKQTAAEKISQSLDQKNVNLADDPFVKWSVLENFAAGYKLIYPAGFKINYDDDQVELFPPSGSGRVVVYIKDKTFEVKTTLENNTNEEAALLNATRELVKDSFEFIDTSGYSLEETEKRFTNE